MNSNLDSFCVPRNSTIGQMASCMDHSGLGIVLIVDDERHLIGTVTDGDLRRAMLSHIGLGESAKVILERKAGSAFSNPITARVGEEHNVYLEILRQHGILHLPIVDEEGRVVGLITRDEFMPGQVLPLQAVVMAGGLGTRLFPLTKNVPKPMLPVGDRPLLEIIIEQLRDSGIKHVNITTHHKGEKIVEHFGDGSAFGIELEYVAEHRPLGTAGGLGLIKLPNEPTLVINGDILTQVDFRSMLAFHYEQHAEATMAVRRYDLQVPYGVVECEGSHICSLREKPQLSFFVNAGIYLIEPSVYSYIPNGQRFDMTDLIQRLLSAGKSVASFPIREHWLDIGQHSDYEQAQKQAMNWKPRS